MDFPLPRRLPAGSGTAMVVCGTCFHPQLEVRRLMIVANGERHRPTASRMPRLDLLRALHPALPGRGLAHARSDPKSRRDPELRAYRSGFWALVPIGGRRAPGAIEVNVEAQLEDGSLRTAPLGSIEVVERHREAPPREGLVAVCMATFDPNPDLLRRQVASLRSQTHPDWVCVVADDCSRPERFAAIEEAVGNDPRFRILHGSERLGFYRNFERALDAVPPEAELVALCDQDDYWYPDKLRVLRAALGDAVLACSDMRLVGADGELLASSLWERRRANTRNMVSLLLSNSVPGAAVLFRRQLLERMLPFPGGTGIDFHDHWIANVALACGRIAYVDRPLYDYVQHPEAVQGKLVGANRGGDETSLPRGARARMRAAWARWRGSYFRGYLSTSLYARVLLVRCSDTLDRRSARGVRWLLAAERSPVAGAWLAVRPLRRLAGRDDTLGMERVVVRGLAWRWMIRLLGRAPERPRRAARDASPPPLEPAQIGTSRLRRWRAQA